MTKSTVSKIYVNVDDDVLFSKEMKTHKAILHALAIVPEPIGGTNLKELMRYVFAYEHTDTRITMNPVSNTSLDGEYAQFVPEYPSHEYTEDDYLNDLKQRFLQYPEDVSFIVQNWSEIIDKNDPDNALIGLNHVIFQTDVEPTHFYKPPKKLKTINKNGLVTIVHVDENETPLPKRSILKIRTLRMIS